MKLVVPAMLAFVLLSPAVLLAEDFQAGVATTDITPPVPYRMSGYFRERLSTGIHDPLQAKAVVFQQGETQAALVFCDLIGIAPELSRQVRRQASKTTGIPEDHIVVAATHTHTGPLYFGALRRHFHRKAVAEKGRDPYERSNYRDMLPEKLVRVIEQAQQTREPVVLTAGTAHEKRLSFNRRFHMKNSERVQFNPGQLNPNILRPAGPIDPEVGIVQFRPTEAKTPHAAIVSFALHLDTVGGTEYSADFPHYLEKHLQTTFSPELTCLFGAGACGDINHIDVSKRGRRSAQEIGTLLGRTVAARTAKLSPLKNPSLAVRSARVKVPLQSYSDDEIAWARRTMEHVGDSDVPFPKRVKAYKITALQMRAGETLPMEVQVFRLAPEVAIVTLPGEIFVELGLAIKKASPFATTLVVTLANDAPGYVPTRKAFAEGSYETVNSRVEPGGGEKLVQTAVRLLKALKPQPTGE